MLNLILRVLPVLLAASAIDSEYSYEPIGKRDPFKTPFEAATIRQDHPLQAFELDQLKLIAVVSGAEVPFAMVEDPTGLGHVVHRGTPIGKHGGRISEISRRKLVVREQYVDYTGRKVTSDVSLVMSEPPLPSTI
jgi:type IV pilus assembly protein PilP